MAVLDVLMLEFQANFADFEAKANQAERRAKELKRNIEQTFKFDINTSALNSINRPGVSNGGSNSGSNGSIDHIIRAQALSTQAITSHLKDLISLQQKTITALGKTGNSSNNPAEPEVIYVDRRPRQPRPGSGGARTSEEKARLAGLMIRNTGAITRQTNQLGRYLNRIVGNTRRQNPIAAALGGVFKLTIGNALRGSFEQLGNQFTQSMLKQTLTTEKGQAAKQSFDKAAANTGQIGINALESYSELVFGGSKMNGKALDVMADDILQAVEFMLDPAVFIRKTDNFRKYAINFASQVEAGRFNDFELVRKVLDDAMTAAPRQLGNVAFRGAQAASFPVKVKKEVETAKAARLLEDFVSDFSRAARMLDKQVEASTLANAKNVIAVSGGFERKGGMNSQALSEMLKPVVEQGTEFLEIKNTFTDRFKGDPQSKIFEAAKSTLEPLGITVGGELKSMLSNLEVNIDAAFKGMNTDAIKLGALLSSLDSLFPHLEMSLAGFSGGGFPVEQAISIREMMGDNRTKGVGIGTPLHGLTATASSNQFKGVLGKLDPLAFMFDKEFINMTQEDIERMQIELAKQGNGDGAANQNLAAFRPADSQALVDGAIDHSVWAYLANEDSYKQIEEFLVGMRKLDEKVSKASVPTDIADKYSDLFEMMGEFVDPFISDARTRMTVVRSAKSNSVLNPKNIGGLDGMAEIANKKVEDRTKKETKRLNDYISNVFEISNSKEIRAGESGIKRVIKQTANKKAEELIEANPDLDKKKLQKELGKLFTELFDASTMGTAMVELSSNRDKALTIAAKESKQQLNKKDSKGLDDKQLVAAAALKNKRESDDVHLLRSLDIFRNRGTSDIESGYEFFNFENPLQKLGTEFQGLLDYVISPVTKALQGSNLEQAGSDYQRLLLNIQAALANFVATGEEIPEAFLTAATDILASDDKLAKLKFPDLLKDQSIPEFSQNKGLLTAGQAKLAGSIQKEDTPINKHEREQLEAINAKLTELNKGRDEWDKQLLVDIANTVKLGGGQMGTALLDKTNNVVVKVKSDKLDPITSAADNFGKAFPGMKPALDAAKGLMEVADSTAMFADEQGKLQKVIDAGLTKDPNRDQVEGALFMRQVKGIPLADKAGVVTGDDQAAIQEFTSDLVRAGALLAKFHEKNLKHGDFHLGNVLKDSTTGDIDAVDFGKLESLPEDIGARNKAVASEFKQAVDATIGLLGAKGIKINPEYLRSALRAGTNGSDPNQAAAQLIEKFEGKLVEQDIQGKKVDRSQPIPVELPTRLPILDAPQEISSIDSFNDGLDTTAAKFQDLTDSMQVFQQELATNITTTASELIRDKEQGDIEASQSENNTPGDNVEHVDAELVNDGSVMKTVAGHLLQATQQIFKVASTAEGVLLGLTPGGHLAKKTIQAVAPAAALGGAALAIPGGVGAVGEVAGLLQTALTPVLSGGGQLLGMGVETAINSAGVELAGLLSGAVEASGVVGAGTIAGALSGGITAATPALAGAAGATAAGGATIAATGAVIAIPTLAASNAISDKIGSVAESLVGDLDAGKEDAKRLTSGIKQASKAVKQLTAGYQSVKSEVLALEPSKGSDKPQLAAARAKQVTILEAQIVETNAALIAAGDDKKESQRIAGIKGNLTKMLNTRLKRAKAEGVEIVADDRLSLKGKLKNLATGNRQALPDFTNMKKVKAEVVNEGDNFVDGFVDQVKGRQAELIDIGVESGEASIKGFKKGIDSASPSKKMAQEGENYVDGFTDEVNASMDEFSNVGEEAGEESVNGFESGRERRTPIGSPFVSSEVGERAGAGLRTVYDLMAQFGTVIDMNTDELGEFFDSLVNGFRTAEEGGNAALFQMAALGSGVGLLLFKDQIIGVGEALFETAKEVEAVQLKLNAIGQGHIDYFDRFGEAADNAGISVGEFAEAYADIEPSARASIVDPQAFFSEMTEGLANRGVSGEGQVRSIKALSQIAGKGVVSMEELRQQLGDALPGAMLIAADSMGLTVAQMNKLVSSGNLLASDFLPKFAKELNNVPEPAANISRELAKMNNIMEEIKGKTAKDIPFVKGIQALNYVAKPLTPLLTTIAKFLTGGLVVALGAVAIAGIKAAAGVALVGTALSAGALGGAALVGLSATVALYKTLTHVAAGAGIEIRKLAKAHASFEPKDIGGISALAKDGDKFSNQNIRSGNVLIDAGDSVLSKEGNPFYKQFNKHIGSKLGFEVGLEHRKGALAAQTDVKDSVNEFLGSIQGSKFKIKAQVTPESIEAAKAELNTLKDEMRSLVEEKGNADALGYSKGQKLELQDKIDKKQEEIDVKINARFDNETLNRVIKDTKETVSHLQHLQETTNSDYSSEIGLLNKELEEFYSHREAIAGVTSSMDMFNEAVKNANANAEALELDDESENIEARLNAYTKIMEAKKSVAAFDARDKLLNLEDIKGNIAIATEKVNDQARIINSAGSTTHDVLAEEGIDKLSAASNKDLIAVLTSLNTRIDDGADISEKAPQVIEAELARRQEINIIRDSQANLIRANEELREALMDVAETEAQLINQQRSMFIEELNLRKAIEDLGYTIYNADLLADKRATEDSTFAVIDNRRDQERSYSDVVRSITDMSRDVVSSIFDLEDGLKQSNAELVAAQLSGFSGYLDAAGLEDRLGISKLVDPITQLVSTKAGDRTESLTRQRSLENQEGQRNLQDFDRQEEDLAVGIRNSNTQLIREIEDIEIKKSRLDDNGEINLLNLQNQLDNASLESDKHNRSVYDHVSRASEYGVSSNIRQVETPIVSLDPESVQSIQQAHSTQRNFLDETIANKRQQLSENQSIQARGSSRIGEARRDLKSNLFARDAMRSEEIVAEGNRVAQEIQNIEDVMEGTMQNILRNVHGVALETEGQVKASLKRTIELMKDVHPDRYKAQILTSVGDDTATAIDQQILDLQKQQESLTTILDLLGKGGDTANAKIDLEARIRKVDLPKEEKDRLLSQIQQIKGDEDVIQFLEDNKEAIEKLRVSEQHLVKNRTAMIDQAKALKKAEFIKDTKSFLNNSNKSLLGAVDDGFDNSIQDRKIAFLIREIELNEELAAKQDEIEKKQKENPYFGQVEAAKALNNATEEYKMKLEQAQKTARTFAPILDAMKAGTINAIKEGLLGIGTALFDNSKKNDERQKLDEDYAAELESLVDGFTGSAQDLQDAKAELDDQRDDIVREIDDELGTTARLFDALRSIMSGFASSIADVAAQMAATAAVKGIAGIFGGGGGGAGGGIVGALIGNAYNGAEVENYNSGGTAGGRATALGLSVQAALHREGSGGVPIVARVGEQILATNNNDAQFFRSLQRRGVWDEMKRINNFSDGGTVGGASNSVVRSNITGSATRQAQVASMNRQYSSNVTVIAQDASSFIRSQDQIQLKTESAQARLSRRGLSK